jgi:arabinan endo-1,5-alpha-L-arabinosidase
VHISSLRKTSVAASAVIGVVLALVMTLLASHADGALAASQHRSASQRAAGKAGAYWSPSHTRAGLAKIQRQAAHRAARATAWHVGSRDRKLGAQPVLSYRGVADPTVARYAGGWVAVSTGPGAPRATAPQPGGPWQNIPSALTTQPSWALSGRYWASDLVEVNGVWLLYFSAEVVGLGLDGRCIGVATASDPSQPFVPGERPLVCPRQAQTPRAYDKVKHRGRDLPKDGVIDPDYFKDRGGQQYLLYRTQGTPSSIRMVKLPSSGLPEGRAQSKELVRRNGVIENPTMLRRGREYVLLTSEGDFGECTYKTTFRHSTDLTDWSAAKRQTLVDTRKSGLCGPGGADLGRGANGEPMLFFHAWTCPELGGNCPGGHNYDRTTLYDARRSLFAGQLRFTSRQSPRIQAYVTPILPPPPPPTESPSASPSGSPTTIGPKHAGTKGAKQVVEHQARLRARHHARHRGWHQAQL